MNWRMILAAAAALVAVPFTSVAEARYAFRERMAVLHPDRRDSGALPVSDDEVSLTGTWHVVQKVSSDILAHAAADLADYLSKSMGVEVAKGAGHSGGTIEIGVDSSLMPLQSRVEASDRLIRITGVTEREALQGCFRLEDMLSERGRPALKCGSRTFTRMFSPRMTHSGWEVEKFPDVYLDQLAHAGMDAILVFIKDPPDVTRNGKEDLNELVERARVRGIDVYAYCWFAVKAAKFHPEDPGAEAWYDETYGSIVKNAPGIRGLVCVGETSGFPSREGHTAGFWWGPKSERVDGKPCNGFYPTLEWIPWLEKVTRVSRKYRPDLEFLFWTYNWYWAAEDVRLKLLEKIPTNITLHVTFEMGDVPVRKLGVDTMVQDYSITRPGPGTVFRSEAEVAQRRGIRLTSMSNTGGRTWDLGCAPYQPAPYSWIARFRSLRESKSKWGLSGLMECHHYGFMPNFIAEIGKIALTEETTDSEIDEALESIAIRDFGIGGHDDAIRAWREWSNAFEWHSAMSFDQYGPLRTGPTYPFVLSGQPWPEPLEPKYEWYEGHRYGNGWKYLLTGYNIPPTRLDAHMEMTRREIACWERGCKHFRAALAKAPAVRRDYGERMLANAEFHMHTARTVLNAQRFKKCDLAKDWTGALAAVDDENRNVRETIPVVGRDSALGWEPTMGYVGDRPNLEWKLRQLADVRKLILERSGASAASTKAMTVQIPADPDGPLEPSVMNEVEHALGRVPECCTTNAPAAFGDIFSTNGLSATAIAVSLVSRQDKDGKWIVNGTNATAEAVSILSSFVVP